jgi:hypothetical protein
MQKRLLLPLAFMTFMLLPANGQVGEYRSEFAMGGSAGIVLSQVGFMPEVPQQQHQGLIGGLTFRYTCEKYFNSVCAVTTELNFAQVGWKQEILTTSDNPVINPVTGEAEMYERTLNYLQIPFLARLGWGRERNGFQAFAQVGPQFGVYLSETVNKNYEYDQRYLQKRTSRIVAQETMAIEHKMEYGITGGAGVEYSHPMVGHLMLEGRYYYGLGDIYGNSKRDYFGRSNLSNIVVKLTYLFDMKKTNNSKIK